MSTTHPGLLRAQWLIGIPLTLLPLSFGGARPWIWSPISAIFLTGVVLLLVWTENPAEFVRGISKKWMGTWGVLLLLPILQAIPLPASWLAVLSPERVVWLHRVQELTGIATPTASISYLPVTTLFSDIWWMVLLCYGLILRMALRRSQSVNWLLHILIPLVCIEAVYGLLQALVPSLGVLWEEAAYRGNATGTFINRNHYAEFLGMIWPLIVAYILTIRKGPSRRVSSSPIYAKAVEGEQAAHKQALLGFIVAVVLLALLFSSSRAGIVCAFAATTIFITFLRAKRKRPIALALIGCWIVAGAYGTFIGFDKIIDRFNKIEENAPERFRIWDVTLHIAQDHLLMGTGLGTHATVFMARQTHISDKLATSHAHNDYLELVSEMGLPAATGMILLVWGFWWRGAILLWRKESGVPEEKRLMGVGALAGSGSFLLHSWVDFSWRIPADQLLFVTSLVLLGWSISDRRYPSAKDEATRGGAQALASTERKPHGA